MIQLLFLLALYVLFVVSVVPFACQQFSAVVLLISFLTAAPGKPEEEMHEISRR
jgi:hypothetical protein